MPGAPLQLVSTGPQDIYLTGNPQMTFFQVVYKKHTNFAIESISMSIDGEPAIGSRWVVNLTPYGDLVSRCWIEIDLLDQIVEGDFSSITNADFDYTEQTVLKLLPIDGSGNPFVYCTRVGYKFINYIDFEVNGILMDRQYGAFMDIRAQIENPPGIPPEKYVRMTSGYLPASNYVVDTRTRRRKVFIPLQFWFNSNPALALPLLAIQVAPCRFVVYGNNNRFRFEYPEGSGKIHQFTWDSVRFWADFIYLDNQERLEFTHGDLEYVVQQVQYSEPLPSPTPVISGDRQPRTLEYTIDFRHPVRSLIFTLQRTTELAKKISYNYLEQNGDLAAGVPATFPIRKSSLIFNAEERFYSQDWVYNSAVQQYETNLGIGYGRNTYSPSPLAGVPYVTAYEAGGFIVYHFALMPGGRTPSGTCNFSKIKDPVLRLEVVNLSVERYLVVWAINWNIFRVTRGVAGMVFSI